jgi:effector-binding domain-containing protein
MNTLELFAIKIYKTKYSKVQEVKNNLFPKLTALFEQTKDNNVASMQDGTLCTYHTNSFLQTFPETKDLIDFAEEHAMNYWKELKYICDVAAP